ncbi:putative copia-type protein, partial [Trifolium pratense]
RKASNMSKYKAIKYVPKCTDQSSSHKRTPVATHLKLTKDEGGVDVDQSMYRSMIRSLQYLTASKPDIGFAVGVCARYQATPKMSHLTQLKRILKYVSGTCDYGMMYSHGEDSMLIGYCDADWAGSADDRKSTSGVQHSRTKHIDIRHHFIRDLVEDKIVTLEHVATENQLADLFTKALDAVQFENLRGKLEPRRVRTKFVAVRPKRIPKVIKSSNPSVSNKESEGRRVKSTAGRNKNVPRANFDFVENLSESNNDFPADTTIGMDFENNTLGKSTMNIDDDVNVGPSVIPPTGGMSANVAASTRANLNFETENAEVPDFETPENIIPETPLM